MMSHQRVVDSCSLISRTYLLLSFAVSKAIVRTFAADLVFVLSFILVLLVRFFGQLIFRSINYDGQKSGRSDDRLAVIHTWGTKRPTLLLSESVKHFVKHLKTFVVYYRYGLLTPTCLYSTQGASSEEGALLSGTPLCEHCPLGARSSRC